MEEGTKTIYGRLLEAAHISGYTLERAMGEFKWLLEDGKWKELGFTDFKEFQNSINFGDFKILTEQRKEIAKLCKEQGASNRDTAKMLKVDEKTIRNDTAENSALDEKTYAEYEDVINSDADNSAPPPETTSEMFKDAGDKLSKTKTRTSEKKEKLKEKKEQYKQKTIKSSGEFSDNKIDIYNTDIKFRIIYADPPWQYDLEQTSPNLGGAIKHYDSMNIDEICDLPIKEIIEKDAVLFLWVTSPKLNLFLDVMQAWGFEYKTSFVWDKIKHNMGHYNSIRHEFLLIGGKGNSAPDIKKLHDSVQSIERTDIHSEKPIEFMNIIDELYIHGDRIELFCRKNKKDNWFFWGNEV